VAGRRPGDGATDALAAVLAAAHESGLVRWDLNPVDLFMPVIPRRQADADLWSLGTVLAAAHGDLKPANILITERAAANRVADQVAGLQDVRDQVANGDVAAGTECVRIIDWGIARAATPACGQAYEGSSWPLYVAPDRPLYVAPGWPHYVAPEVATAPVLVDFSVLAARALARTDGDAAAGRMLTRIRANPFTLFAVRGSGSPQAVTLTIQVHLLVEDVRAGLLRFIDAILAAFSLVLVLLLSALAHRPAVTAFTLLLIAVARCFGRRSETDDLRLPAHQSSSVAGGPPGRQ
jgi:hypothetical protein